MMNSTATGGQLLVKCLQSLGAQLCFGVPGESYLAVLDALHDAQGELEFIGCRNEGGAAFMAESYGKLTGNPGVCLVTRGPGATNASIGIHTAMQNSSPLLLLIGQVGTNMRGREVFQEIDYRAYFGSIAKWVVEIDDAERIPELLARAWSTALSGRPGPVVVSLPENMLIAITGQKPCRPIVVPEPAPSHDDIVALTDKLRGAQRPLLLVGGGRWKSAGQRLLKEFAERHTLPVASVFRFHDLLDNYSDSYVGDAGVGMSSALKLMLAEADVILAVGVRMGEMTTAEYTLLEVPNPACTLIHVHPSAEELGKIYAPDLPIQAGPNQLFISLKTVAIDTQPWKKWTQLARQAYLDGFAALVQPGAVDMFSVINHLQECLPSDAIITHGAGNFTAWPDRFMKYGADQRLLAPQSGAMGYGLPAAIAAKKVHPDKTVLCFAGDGDIQMNVQELGTAMQVGARPIILILNNSTYGTIRMHQERHYPHRVIGTDIVNPDFVTLARAYGFHAERVVSTDEFVGAFERAMASPAGAVIELVIPAEASTPTLTLKQIQTG
jgi:acetolactate synthase-1/2/3 large subunit